MDQLNALAVLPIYADGIGNVCEIYDFNGNVTQLNHTVRTQMSQFARIRNQDFHFIKHKVHTILGIKKNIPLAYAHDFIFIPIRVREPRTKNDGAHAYIRLNAIGKVSDYQITLVTGEVLSCLQKKEAIQEALRRAKVVEQVLYMEEREESAKRELLSALLKDASNFYKR